MRLRRASNPLLSGAKSAVTASCPIDLSAYDCSHELRAAEAVALAELVLGIERSFRWPKELCPHLGDCFSRLRPYWTLWVPGAGHRWHIAHCCGRNRSAAVDVMGLDARRMGRKFGWRPAAISRPSPYPRPLPAGHAGCGVLARRLHWLGSTGPSGTRDASRLR